MFAVINTGGKQYKVAAGSVIQVEKIEGAPGAKIDFDNILMIGEATKPQLIGTPTIKGAKVKAEIIDQMRGEKVIVFKKKRRQNYRRKNGHRQNLTQVKILDIVKK